MSNSAFNPTNTAKEHDSGSQFGNGTLVELLRGVAGSVPDWVAVASWDESKGDLRKEFTYKELCDVTERVSGELGSLNVRKAFEDVRGRGHGKMI